MAHRFWTAEQLETLRPAERQRIFEAGIVRDLGELPPKFLAKIRARIDARIEATESPSTS